VRGGHCQAASTETSGRASRRCWICPAQEVEGAAFGRAAGRGWGRERPIGASRAKSAAACALGASAICRPSTPLSATRWRNERSSA